MLLPRLISYVLPLAAAVGASTGHGQSYPSKPVRIIASTAGGSSDFTARLISPGLTAAKFSRGCRPTATTC